MEIRPHPSNQNRSPYAGNHLYRAIVTYENPDERQRVGWLAPLVSLERWREYIDRESFFLTTTPEYPHDVTVSHRTLSRIAAKLLIDPPQMLSPKGEEAEALLDAIMTYFDESRQVNAAKKVAGKLASKAEVLSES